MSSTDVILDQLRLAVDLREAWLNRRQVRVTLTDRCVLPTIVGRVSSVSVTGAFSTIDGWHVPTGEIRGVGKPVLGDVETYAQAMRDLRKEAAGHDA